MPPRKSPAEEVAEAVADDLTDGKVFVLDRRDLARRAALDGFRRGVGIVAEMAADHGSGLLVEAVEQIRVLPNDTL